MPHRRHPQLRLCCSMRSQPAGADQAGTAPAEAAGTAPALADPALADPALADPALGDPVGADPASGGADPAGADPAGAESVGAARHYIRRVVRGSASEPVAVAQRSDSPPEFTHDGRRAE
jgi:hypothetical protein